MSTDTPSREPTLEQRIHMTSSFQSFLHKASLFMLVGAPILIALPPRKLDLYTFSLTGAFIASANHMVKERTGAGLFYQLPGARLPPAAIEHQERMKLREGGRRLLEEGQTTQQERPSVQERLQKYQRREPAGLEKAAKDIWMGGEKDDWKQRRLAEEQRKLDEGEGYWGMIVDQVWEVWNQGKDKAEEVREKDEEVVESNKRAKRREEEFPTIGKQG